jgi:succinyl-CoA synthetase alpha subunit
VAQTTAAGLGQSTCVGIGGDPVKGMDFIDVLELFLADDETQSIIMIGEIGGEAEVSAPSSSARELRPRQAEQAGGRLHRRRHRPPGRRMGHAGAVISGGKDTAEPRWRPCARPASMWPTAPSALGSTMVKALRP